jgi:hypothetical protein
MTQAITITDLTLPDRSVLQTKLGAVRAFQAAVHEFLVDGSDYGVIPGTDKPTLLKPGAEKIVKLLDLADTYDVVNSLEDWDRGRFHYQVRCRLIAIGSGVVVAEGVGACNSMESRYRWRWVWQDELAQLGQTPQGLRTRPRGDGVQYRVENDDVYSQVNTILKIAKKRAQVDAALSVGRLSEVFTQDLEDMEMSTAGRAAARQESGPRCPKHPNRDPKEKQFQGKTLLYCSAKVGNAWCDWQVEKPRMQPQRPAPTTIDADPPSPTVGRDPSEIIAQGQAAAAEAAAEPDLSDTAVWAQLKDVIGKHDPSGALGILEVASLAEWRTAGHTNRQALGLLLAMHDGRDRDEAMAALGITQPEAQS